MSRRADYDSMPDADVILVTRERGHHPDPGTIAKIRTADGFEVTAVPACNADEVRYHTPGTSLARVAPAYAS